MKTIPSMRIGLALLLCVVMVSSPARGQQETIVLLVSADNKIYSQMSEGLQERLHAPAKVMMLNSNEKSLLHEIHAMNPPFVIAIGDAAALWAHKNLAGRPLLISGVIQQFHPSGFKGMKGVGMDFPADAYLKLAKDALPELKKVGLVYNPAVSQAFVDDLKKAAGALAVNVNARPLTREGALGSAMEGLTKWGVELFLVTYDPLVMNPETWQYLVGYSVKHHIALLVPAKSLLKSGGVLSLEADYVELGRQAADMANQAAEGGAAMSVIALGYPRKEAIGMNLKMANVIGVAFHPSVRERALYVYE